jgi:hypothetical protein
VRNCLACPSEATVRGLAGPAWVCRRVKTLALKVARSVRLSAFSNCRGVWAGETSAPGERAANVERDTSGRDSRPVRRVS